MKALIAFIVMAVLILTLTEINERVKAKRNPTSPAPLKGEEGECETQTDGEDCSACELISVCEKDKKKTGQ